MNAPFNFNADIWSKLSLPQQLALGARAKWLSVARPNQITPIGNWAVWLMLAGRGFGKTRAGAEDVVWYANRNPGCRTHIIAPTYSDARDTCIEGESGVLSILPKQCINTWNRSMGELHLENGSRFKLFGAEEPDRLRGPQAHRAWCDELGAWRYAETWDQMLFGLRLGQDPKAVVTTTPKPTKLIKELVRNKKTIVTRGSTFDNSRNLAPAALAQLKAKYEGTRLGRQELYAEVLEQAEGALWTLEMIENARHVGGPPEMSRKVVSIDPAITSKAESNLTGIIGAGLGVDRRGYVLADATGQYSPDQWATKAVELYHSIGADRFVAEGNQGGEMVRHTIASVWRNAPITIVHASRNKQARAEPVVALYEQNKISHVGVFPELEGQMCVAEDTLVSTFRGDVKISDIRLDDKILTREGFYPLKWVGRTGEKTTLILKSSSGLSVRLTDNHPVFIDGKGFIRSDEIQIGDRIIECLENQRITALSFKEENIIERSPVITQESLKAKRQPYTGTLGNFLKVQFQKAMMFITEMKIHPIMTSTILSVLQEKSTTPGMQHQVGQFGRLIKEGKHQLHLGQLESQELLFANSAAGHIKRQGKLLNSAQENAGEFPIVVAIEQSTLTEVWDLTVDGPPEFFANGILVHNCSWEPLSNPPMPSPDRLDAMVWAFTDLMLGYDGRPVFGKY